MRNILIVDDDSAMVEVMVRALNRYPKEFSILTAYNGTEAISILEQTHIDLISTDLNMPVLNGYHLLVYILKHCPATPVLILTAFDISTMRERISQRGFRSISYIQKPFSLKYYIATIREQLSNAAKGFIEESSLFNILQLLQLEQKTCAIRIYSTQGEGHLSFIDGELTHAWCNEVVGPEAVYMLMTWSDLRIDLRDAPPGTHQTITTPLSHLLMESVRRQDEADDVYKTEDPSQDNPQTFPLESPDDNAAPDTLLITPIRDDSANLDDAHLFDDDTPELFSRSGKEFDMSNVQQSLDEAMTIDGAIGVALVDYQSGMALGTAGGSTFNLEVAAAGNTEVIRAKLKVMSSLGLKDSIEDILITLGNQYHLIRLLKTPPGLFLYLVLSKSQANLAMSRHRLAQIETSLSI